MGTLPCDCPLSFHSILFITNLTKYVLFPMSSTYTKAAVCHFALVILCFPHCRWPYLSLNRIRLAHNKANQVLPDYDPQSDVLAKARAGGNGSGLNGGASSVGGSTAELTRLRCEVTGGSLAQPLHCVFVSTFALFETVVWSSSAAPTHPLSITSCRCACSGLAYPTLSRCATRWVNCGRYLPQSLVHS